MITKGIHLGVVDDFRGTDFCLDFLEYIEPVRYEDEELEFRDLYYSLVIVASVLPFEVGDL